MSFFLTHWSRASDQRLVRRQSNVLGFTSDPITQPRFGKGRFCCLLIMCYQKRNNRHHWISVVCCLKAVFQLSSFSLYWAFPINHLRQEKCFQCHYGYWAFTASSHHEGSFLKPVLSRTELVAVTHQNGFTSSITFGLPTLCDSVKALVWEIV